jgi:hypothetical protein
MAHKAFVQEVCLTHPSGYVTIRNAVHILGLRV